MSFADLSTTHANVPESRAPVSVAQVIAVEASCFTDMTVYRTVILYARRVRYSKITNLAKEMAVKDEVCFENCSLK